MLHLVCALLIVIGSGTRSWAAPNREVGKLLTELDKTLDERPAYLEQKLKSIRADSIAYETSTSPKARMNALQRLFNDYESFNADSAYAVNERLIRLAEGSGDRDRAIWGRMNKAYILTSTGMYSEGLALLDSIDRASLKEEHLPHYFHIKRTAYGYMADFAVFEADKQRYDRLRRAYRDSILAVNSYGSLAHMVTLADKLNNEGMMNRALEELQKYTPVTEHERAICYWTMAESYKKLGDDEKYEEMLLRSAISDMKSSVREYISLRDLAMWLYKKGDLDRAYRLLSISLEDASACNARLRIFELSNFYPSINSIYVDTVKTKNHSLIWALVLITLLLGVAVTLIIFTRKQMRKAAAAHSALNQANRQLEELNDQLFDSNSQLSEANDRLSEAIDALSEANRSIAEISELKEVYIGRYMGQCLGYIEKLDSFRKNIGKLATVEKLPELKKLTKSTTLIDEELKHFYFLFDSTFLSLFPSFVEDFNALLQPEERIVPKRAGALTPELRIYALLRLGITGNEQIANFLRYSLTTIYNYRTKMRNRALGDRNRFDEMVLKIGR